MPQVVELTDQQRLLARCADKNGPELLTVFANELTCMA